MTNQRSSQGSNCNEKLYENSRFARHLSQTCSCIQRKHILTSCLFANGVGTHFLYIKHHQNFIDSRTETAKYSSSNKHCLLILSYIKSNQIASHANNRKNISFYESLHSSLFRDSPPKKSPNQCKDWYQYCKELLI